MKIIFITNTKNYRTIAEEVAKMWVDGISNMEKSFAYEDSDIAFSLRNKNININDKIKVVMNKNYITVGFRNYKQLNNLKNRVRNLPRNVYRNKATGFNAKIDSKCINKILRPTHSPFNIWSDRYIDNLNAAIYLPKLFENAVYVDSGQNGKVKNNNKQIKEFHYFVAPIYMNNNIYRVLITAKEKAASNSLYAVNAEVINVIKKGNTGVPNTKNVNGNIISVFPLEISVTDVVKGVKLRDYVNNTNKNYSINDIKFSLKEPIEVGDKLIAMHNITQDKLWKALKLGGFPMLSLAVTKAKIGHTNFGDISLLFDKSTIDPEADSRNKVYGADAWTPVFPQIDYKLNEKKADEVYDRANKVGDLAFFNPVSLANTNLESKVKDVNGDSLVEHFKNDYGLKNMYLAEKGEPVKMLFEEKDRGGDIGKWFAENCKNEVLEYNKIENNPEDETQYVLDNKEKLSEVYANYLRKVKKEKEEHITERINRRPMLLIGLKSGLMSGMDSLEGKKDKVENIEATEKLIDDKVNQADYEKWLKDLFAGIVEKEGIYNGKDPYTASGNRRSFEKLHYDVTLDNIVQAMIDQADSVRIKVGDEVKYSGYVYRDSVGKGRGSKISGTFTVSLRNSNKYGVHLKGYGWVKPGDCKK